MYSAKVITLAPFITISFLAVPDLQDAISMLERGDAREASVLLEDMSREMPGYATARVLLARAYEGLGEWGSALGAWREALQIVPNSPVIRRGLERAARKATSRAPIEELPELPSVSVHPSAEVDITGPGAEVASPGSETQNPDRDEEAAAPTPRPDEDLDRLIAELESAQIVPRPDLDDLPDPELDDDIEDVVSVTLARIYASQGQYDEAARVYELLSVQQPESEEDFREKAAEMRSKASED